HVVARGQLRHHPAPPPVDVDLRGDDVGQRAAAVLHHRRTRLVAGGLQPQHQARARALLRHCPSSLSIARTSPAASPVGASSRYFLYASRASLFAPVNCCAIPSESHALALLSSAFTASFNRRIAS